MQELFGENTGRTIHDHARGQDDDPIVVSLGRSSISAEISWGVRLETDGHMNSFLGNLCRYLCARLSEEGSDAPDKGILALKVKKRRPNAGRPGKHLGHGPCTDHSKTAPDLVQIRRFEVLYRAVRGLWLTLKNKHCFDVTKDHVRGVAISISSLTKSSRTTTVMEDYYMQKDLAENAAAPHEEEGHTADDVQQQHPTFAMLPPSKVNDPRHNTIRQSKLDECWAHADVRMSQISRDLGLSQAVDKDVYDALPMDAQRQLAADAQRARASKNYGHTAPSFFYRRSI